MYRAGMAAILSSQLAREGLAVVDSMASMHPRPRCCHEVQGDEPGSRARDRRPDRRQPGLASRNPLTCCVEPATRSLSPVTPRRSIGDQGAIDKFAGDATHERTAEKDENRLMQVLVAPIISGKGDDAVAEKQTRFCSGAPRRDQT